MGLLTPVLKGVLHRLAASPTAVKAQQVLGGHGYIAEWGMEQFVRDARITMIYEGANGIQALDLVGRKLPQGRRPRGRWPSSPKIDGFLAAQQGRRGARALLAPVKTALGQLQQATMWLMQNGMANPDNAGAASTDYMHLFGLTALGYMWARIAKAVLARQAAGTSDPALDAKLALAQFFARAHAAGGRRASRAAVQRRGNADGVAGGGVLNGERASSASGTEGRWRRRLREPGRASPRRRAFRSRRSAASARMTVVDADALRAALGGRQHPDPDA